MSASDRSSTGKRDPRERDDGYLAAIPRAVRSIFDGMAVTFAELTRHLEGHNHTTVEYPDRTAIPVVESLPERYRGFLEVDLDICTGCKACERDCPIQCIAIDLEKIEGHRAMTRFDIDMGKCMYCGICVESCPIEGQAPGDAEVTKSIRMTREFEAATTHFPSLTFRFIRPGDHVPPFKAKRGQVEPTPRRGEIAREVRKKGAEWNALAFARAREELGSLASLPDGKEVLAAVDERAVALAERLAAVGSPEAAVELLVAEALAQTDCGACGWPTCRAYAGAILDGSEPATWRCEPAGAKGARDATLLVQLRRQVPVDEAKRAAAEAVERYAKGTR